MNTNSEHYLIEWRKAVLRGDTLKDRLAILRQLVAVAGPSSVWDEIVAEHEKIRLSAIAAKIKGNDLPSRGELLEFDRELGQCTERHSSSVASLRAEIAERLALGKQSHLLEEFRKRLGVHNQHLPPHERKAHYEKIVAEMRKTHWEFPSAQEVLAEAQRRIQDIIREECKAYTKDNKIDFLNKVLVTISKTDWKDPDAAQRLRNDIEQLLADAVESRRQERIRAAIFKITSVVRNSNRDISIITRNRHTIVGICGSEWLEKDQWMHEKWLTQDEKNTFQGALQWYEVKVRRLATEANIRWRWHFFGLGVLTALSSIVAWSNSTKFSEAAFGQSVPFLLLLVAIPLVAVTILRCTPILRKVPVFIWAVLPCLYALLEPWMIELRQHDWSLSFFGEQWQDEFPIIIFSGVIVGYALMYSGFWIFLTERYIKSRTTLWTWVMAGCFLLFSVLGVTAFAMEKKGIAVIDLIGQVVQGTNTSALTPTDTPTR